MQVPRRIDSINSVAPDWSIDEHSNWHSEYLIWWSKGPIFDITRHSNCPTRRQSPRLSLNHVWSRELNPNWKPKKRRSISDFYLANPGPSVPKLELSSHLVSDRLQLLAKRCCFVFKIEILALQKWMYISRHVVVKTDHDTEVRSRISYALIQISLDPHPQWHQ